MKEKISLIADLIKISKSDNQISDIEYEFLLAIANQLKISKSEFDKLFNVNVEFAPQKNEFERILHFQRLILMMNIDQKSDENEIQLIRDLGIKLGLNTIATERVLEEMDNYPNKVVPPEKLIEIFSQHYN